jgi:hypothetical protein
LKKSVVPAYTAHHGTPRGWVPHTIVRANMQTTRQIPLPIQPTSNKKWFWKLWTQDVGPFCHTERYPDQLHTDDTQASTLARKSFMGKGVRDVWWCVKLADAYSNDVVKEVNRLLGHR